MLVGRLAGVLSTATEESRHAASEEKERLLVDREKRTTEVAALKMRIKTARGQSGTSEELEAVKGRLGNYDANRKDLELKIRELKYELNYQTKEFETARSIWMRIIKS